MCLNLTHLLNFFPARLMAFIQADKMLMGEGLRKIGPSTTCMCIRPVQRSPAACSLHPKGLPQLPFLLSPSSVLP